VLRVLAVERVLRALLLFGGAYALLRFRSSQATLRDLFAKDLPAARPLADRLGVDVDHSSLVNLVSHALSVKTSTLLLIAAVVGAYGALELVEGVGLWLLRRWAEYLTVIATAAFLPLEIHELTKSVTPTKLIALVINIAAVVYLLLAKRLFGIRGGRAAYERDLQGESLLEVEAAADEQGPPADRVSGQEAGMAGSRPA
jgi:uncharacterized membrane protein (DUF2068 family)